MGPTHAHDGASMSTRAWPRRVQMREEEARVARESVIDKGNLEELNKQLQRQNSQLVAEFEQMKQKVKRIESLASGQIKLAEISLEREKEVRAAAGVQGWTHAARGGHTLDALPTTASVPALPTCPVQATRAQETNDQIMIMIMIRIRVVVWSLCQLWCAVDHGQMGGPSRMAIKIVRYHVQTWEVAASCARRCSRRRSDTRSSVRRPGALQPWPVARPRACACGPTPCCVVRASNPGV